MSHKITSADRPVYVGQRAWHSLGTVISAEQAAGMTHRDLASTSHQTTSHAWR